MRVCRCVYLYVCQLEWSCRTGAPLPCQHFLVINDFFLPSLSFSMSLSLSLWNWWHLHILLFSVTWQQKVGVNLGARNTHAFLQSSVFVGFRIMHLRDSSDKTKEWSFCLEELEAWKLNKLSANNLISTRFCLFCFYLHRLYHSSNCFMMLPSRPSKYFILLLSSAYLSSLSQLFHVCLSSPQTSFSFLSHVSFSFSNLS